jgi:hypothetical protein
MTQPVNPPVPRSLTLRTRFATLRLAPCLTLLLPLLLALPALLHSTPLTAQEPGVAASDSGADTETDAETETKADPSVLVGRVTRDQVEAAVPNWVRAEIEADVDPATAADLAHVPPGAEVTVYLGTWCSDSRHALSRLWRALDEAGGMVDFRLDYIAVDRDKKQPAELVEGSDLRYVPTFIVRRDGVEVGRIVEEAPQGILAGLTSLLEGRVTGVVSTRGDVGPES